MENFIIKSFKDGIEAHAKGNEDVAKYNYKKILEKDFNHSDANHNLAVILFNNGKFGESFPFFKRALQTNPAVTKFWLSYINILIKLIVYCLFPNHHLILNHSYRSILFRYILMGYEMLILLFQDLH